MFSDTTKITKTLFAIGLATVMLTGCAPRNVTSTSSGMVMGGDMQAIYRQMVDQTLRQQQKNGLDIGQFQGAALCNQLVDGLPQSQPRYLPVNQLTIVNSAENALLCAVNNNEGKTIKFVARNTGQATEADGLRAAVGEQATLGLELKDEGSALTVVGMMPGSPAARSGELQTGDRIVGVSGKADGNFASVDAHKTQEIVEMIRGEAGQPITLAVLGKGAMQTRQITLTREIATPEQIQAYTQQKRKKVLDSLVIEGTSGQYMSPYTSDGVVAEWVNKAINAKIGSATGSAVGSAAGAYAGQKALENVPGGGFLGSMLGGMAGSAAGKSAGREAAIEASGGWDHIRATSDLSFRSLGDMAKWLVHKHGDSSTFTEVVNATQAVYPELDDALARLGR